MKKLQLFFCLAMISQFSIAIASPGKTVMATHRTVVDYYRLLPAQYFEIDRNELLKPDWSPLIDLRNDYMSTAGDGAQSHLEIAVFRYHGHDTIAISSTYGDDYEFDLWRYEKGVWTRVTKELSSMAHGSQRHFVLPRYGTTIQVLEASNGWQPAKNHIANLYWAKGKFNKVSVASAARR